MEKIDAILKKLALLKPEHVLDVGCGCGGFTAKLSPYCGRITAVDSSRSLIDRCEKENHRANVTYLCMDGRDLRFPAGRFDLVLERGALHHVLEWEKVLEEMMRVSSRYILVQEPIDDPRSEEKRNTIRAQELFMELQNEVGFSHHRYLPPDYLNGYFQKRNIPTELQILKSDEPVDFDQYFKSFDDFAKKSGRRKYWLGRLESLRRELDDKKLCEEDTVFIVAIKS